MQEAKHREPVKIKIKTEKSLKMLIEYSSGQVIKTPNNNTINKK